MDSDIFFISKDVSLYVENPVEEAFDCVVTAEFSMTLQ
jgi:hypothetical protein